MLRLMDFRAYVLERRSVAEKIEERLNALQQNYETFFQQIARTREEEFAQLSRLFGEAPDALDAELRAQLDRELEKAREDFDSELAKVRAAYEGARDAAEAQRAAALSAERTAHRDESTADAAEETFKRRVELLRQRIEEYNARIRQMSSGFGFFSNFFKARDLLKERHLILEEQMDVVARIEKLRASWVEAEAGYAAEDAALRAEWRELQSQAATAKAKLDYLEDNRERIVARSVMERVLYERRQDRALGVSGDPLCPSCERPNPQQNFFCAYCATRLGPDRTDVDGSLVEIAELNQHYLEFSDGMKSCQEIIALVRGLRSGLEAFQESVESMIHTESNYPVPKLRIGVPEPSVRYGRNLDRLKDLLMSDSETLHPVAFAAHVKQLIDGVFVTERIQTFFETMGKELSRCADAQW